MLVSTSGTVPGENLVWFGFPGRWEVFSSNELTLGGFLDGAGHQKYQVMIRKLDFLALPSHFPDRGEELEMRLMIMSTY